MSKYIGFSPNINFTIESQSTGLLNLNSKLNIVRRNAIDVEYLIIAGGGGGGTPSGGGGGAGGLLNGIITIVKGSTLTITVGGGGAVNTAGTPTVVNEIATATGGGFGGRNPGIAGNPGGNGGGGAGGSTGGASPGGAGTPGQGFGGGGGNNGSCNDFNPDFMECNNHNTGPGGGGGGLSAGLNSFPQLGTIGVGGPASPKIISAFTGNGGGGNSSGSSGRVEFRFSDKFDSEISTGNAGCNYYSAGGFKFYGFTSSGSIRFLN